jgi:tRNA pseudouridine55 synthase
MMPSGFNAVFSEGGDVLLVDKPVDWTSFDVVAKIRSAYKKAGAPRKVGHSGTLDPKASGLLVLATGKKTKTIPTLEVLDKVYDGVIRLGALTESHDTETPEYGWQDTAHLTESGIRDAAASFLGNRLQQPPMHSAVRHNGKRLYELARKGHEVRERKSREIHVYRFDITAVNLPLVYFTIKVSKGAYIRVIAHELGDMLGVGGYLKGLRRIAVGPYELVSASSVSQIVDAIAQNVMKAE